MPNIGAPELIIIAVALVVLFGATKLPTFARSVGRSMRIFKSEVKGLQKDDDEPETKATATQDTVEESKAELTEATSPAANATSSVRTRQSAEQR